MSKEYLEAFSRITLHTDFDNDGSYDIEKFEDDCKGVEEALQKLDDIKNSKQSEAMECFKRVWNDINGHNDFRQDFKDLTNIENYILKAQEQETVLNIIKEKNVDILDVKIFKNYKHYCRAMEDSGLRKDWWLTEEEFNTLKEYFKE